MKKRIRNRQIVIRLSEDEYEILKEKVKKSGKTQQEFLIRLIKNKKIINTFFLERLVFEFRKIGININQLTKFLNENNKVSDENLTKEFLEFKKEFEKIWQLLRQLIQNLK